jgi:hypothetical protein
MPLSTPTTGMSSMLIENTAHRHRGGDLDPRPVREGEGDEHVVGRAEPRGGADVPQHACQSSNSSAPIKIGTPPSSMIHAV